MPNHTFTAVSTLLLAAHNAAACGQLAQAVDISGRALDMAEKIYGKDSLEYARCLAEASFNYESCEIYHNQLDAPDHEVALTMRNLAEMFRRQGRELEAKRLELEAGKVLGKLMEKAQ
jgi:hypothetical protein